MKATQIVHWTGKDVLACEEHTRQLQALGGIICGDVSTTPYFGEVECGNCVNEAEAVRP